MDAYAGFNTSLPGRRTSRARENYPWVDPVCESGAVYTPRHAEESILHSVVAESLETFLAMQ